MTRGTDIGAETIVSAIKDVLLKLQLSLVNCKGQCYDGASNMMGRKTGVGKRIQDLQPKAYLTHCHGHSLVEFRTAAVFLQITYQEPRSKQRCQL